MRDFTLSLGKLSLQGSVVILVVFAIRIILDKLNLSKKYVNLLWFVPFLCLILPWRMESDFSIWQYFEKENIERSVDENTNTSKNTADDINGTEIIYDNTKHENSNIQSGATTPNEKLDITDDEKIISENVKEAYSTEQDDASKSNNDIENSINIYDIVCEVWFIVFFGILAYSVIDYIKLVRVVKVCINVEENVYYSEGINVPFVLGVIKPHIFLPINIHNEHTTWIIEHEKTHIYRKDPIKKLLVYIITCVHWFNPVVWLAFWFFGKDMEMACDEETVRRLGEDKRHEYADVLLATASKKGIGKLGAFPAFGGSEVKGRIRNVLKNKKTTRIMLAVVVLLVICMSIVFLTNGKDKKDSIINVDTEKEMSKSEVTENDTFDSEEDTTEQATTEEDIEPVEKVEFTLDTLFELYENGNLRDEFKYQGWEDKLKYNNFIVKKESENADIWNYIYPFTYNEKNFEFQVSYTVGTGDAANNLLNGISVVNIDKSERYVLEPEWDQFMDLYSFLDEEGRSPRYELDFELPDEIKEDEFEYIYYENIEGFVFDKDYKSVDKSDECPVTHYAPVGIGRIETSNRAIFDENGKLTEIYYFYKFSQKVEGSEEYVEGCSRQAILCTISNDLFITEREDGKIVDTYEKFVEENGREPEKATMDYWCIFLAEQDSEYCYSVYLNKDYFTKDEAIQVARTVKVIGENE